MKGHLLRIPIQTHTETEETKKVSDLNPPYHVKEHFGRLVS